MVRVAVNLRGHIRIVEVVLIMIVLVTILCYMPMIGIIDRPPNFLFLECIIVSNLLKRFGIMLPVRRATANLIKIKILERVRTTAQGVIEEPCSSHCVIHNSLVINIYVVIPQPA